MKGRGECEVDTINRQRIHHGLRECVRDSLDCLRSSLRRARPEYNCKRHHSLGRMDGGSRNIRGAGRSGHQQAVRFVLEMGMTVRIVNVLYNFRGVEQDHDVVRENTDSIDAELFL